MPFSLETLLILLIFFALCAIGLVKFHAYWQLFLKSMKDTFVELFDFFGDTNFKTLMAEDATKQKEPLTWKMFRYRFAIPLMLTISFLPCFLLMQLFGTIIMQNKAQGGSLGAILICAGIIALLVVLVIGVCGHYEKRPRRKFWFRLIITLTLELGIAFDLYLLFNGYFFKNAITTKRFVSALLFVPLFIESCVKTQRNWQSWQREKDAPLQQES